MGAALATSFLNAQGRVLFEGIACCPRPNLLVLDVSRAQLPEILRMLQRYRLRSRVELSDHSAHLAVLAAAGPDVSSWVAAAPRPDPAGGAMLTAPLAFPDPRTPLLGVRALVAAAGCGGPHEAAVSWAEREWASRGWARVGEPAYDAFRIAQGAAQGAGELPSGNCFPLESNLEMLSGVSFTKGCYVGQELTARTHFRGQVRKRLLPLLVDPPGPHPGSPEAAAWAEAMGVPDPLRRALAGGGRLPPPGTALRWAAAPAADSTAKSAAAAGADAEEGDGGGPGKVVGGVGPAGLALVRLSAVADRLRLAGVADADPEALAAGTLAVWWEGGAGQLVLPPWWPRVAAAFAPQLSPPAQPDSPGE